LNGGPAIGSPSDRDPEDADNSAIDDGTDAKTSKNRQQELIKLISDLPDSACLVFVEDKVDKRQKTLINQVESKGVLAEIGQEQPSLLRQWVEAECKQRGLMIEPLAAESLVDRCSNSMQILWQEMDKIFLYMAYAQQTRIDRQVIEILSLPDLRGNIFDMTDAISRGQTARALELLDLLLGQKEPAQLIAFMLARHFRQLICAKDLGRSDSLIRELKVMPFVANRLLQQAKALSVERMERIYSLCFETDLAVKTGQLPERIALEILLVSAAEAARPGVASPA
jgi:DNA polymerase-3 subunit delta